VSSFQYTQANGIELESDYAYTGTQGTCAYSSSKVAFTNTGNIQVPENNATLLKHAVNLQPISVAIEADQQAFQLYSSGIISSNCGTNLDHAVLIVGYGTSDGTDYWIVKNQWGTSWGQAGYVQIASGSQNSGAGVCGINSQPAFPTL
jgi:C1A family cysteine protease